MHGTEGVTTKDAPRRFTAGMAERQWFRSMGTLRGTPGSFNISLLILSMISVVVCALLICNLSSLMRISL